MAEEEKQEEQASSEQVEATETQTQEQAQEEKIDWESRHKEAEAELTKVREKAAEDEQMLELVTPHVDWNAVQGGTKPTETKATDDESAEEFISRKEHEERLSRVQATTEGRILTLQLRTEHPELRPYEDSLIAPEVARLRRANPTLRPEQLLEKATKFATDFLEAERAKGIEKAKEEQQTKATETAKASGFASAGATTPKKDEAQGGESAEDYIARRKQQSRKNRGLE
jgi:hypothetical protein